MKKPLSEVEIAKGKGPAQGCYSCHRVGGRGSYFGSDLTAIGASRSVGQVQNTLVSPNKDVSPENRHVQVTTSDGKTIAAGLLSHDGFCVPLIDANRQLRPFETETLREFTIVTTNPMPSYANQMSAQELTDPVDHVSSLKGNEKPSMDCLSRQCQEPFAA